jgi:hypothetical protein
LGTGNKLSGRPLGSLCLLIVFLVYNVFYVHISSLYVESASAYMLYGTGMYICTYRRLRVRMFYLQVEVTINNVLSTFLPILTNAL